MTDTVLSKYLSDTIKKEKTFTERFSWEYLRDLHQILIALFTHTPKHHEPPELKFMIQTAIREVQKNPYPMHDYLNISPSRRRRALHNHVMKNFPPPVLVQLKKKSRKIQNSHSGYEWLKRLFGLI